MAIETEFKFLISKLPEKNFTNVVKYHIDQIYFDGSKKKDEILKLFPDIDFDVLSTFRVRKIICNDKNMYIITLKSRPLLNGMSRYEYEKEIDINTFNQLITGNIESEVIKNRYVDMFDGYKFEFDEYLNLAKDLFTVEIEVNNVDNYETEVMRFISIVKDHYGLEARDVTHNLVYKNSNLIKYFGK